MHKLKGLTPAPALFAFCLLSCLFLTACGPAEPLPPPSSLLIDDPSFENAHWVLSDGAECRDDRHAHSGSKSVYIPGSDTYPRAIATYSVQGEATPGTYILSVYGRGNSSLVNIMIYLGGSDYLQQRISFTGAAWQEQKLAFTVPAGTSTLEFAISNYAEAGQDVYLDDVTVAAVGTPDPGATNLVRNPGFEDSTIWAVTGASYQGGAGARYMLLPGQASGNSVISQMIDYGFTQGMTYLLSFYMKSNNAAGVYCGVYAQPFGSSNYPSLYFSVKASAYTEYNIAFIMPAGTTAIYIGFLNSDTTGKDLCLDNVSVREIS